MNGSACPSGTVHPHRILSLLVTLLVALWMSGKLAAQTDGPVPAPAPAPVKLFMPDGQLRSHAIRVFVTENLRGEQKPELRWKPMLRVRPAVYWQDGGGERVVVGETEVNVGDIVPAFCWTASIVVASVLVLVLMAKLAGSSAWRFLTGVDGRLSLAQTQVALWTFVIGSVVLGYGLVKFEVPDIPASLLALMGASLATGGIAYFKDSKKQQTAAAAGPAPAPGRISLGDLVRTSSGGETSELSLAKAQLLFWTVLQLVLFLFKSVLDGVIWEVPWPLVALMGFSQAGYLAPKLAPPQ
jgi:hypothetical protein